MELTSYFQGLLSNIEPKPAAVAKARNAHEDLREFLEEDSEISKAYLESYLSGSYARNTALNTIKDVDVIVLVDLDYQETRPDVAITWLQASLQKKYSKVKTQGRSVHVTTGTGFDLDVVLAVPITRNDGPVRIPDRDAREWVATHPKGQIAFGIQKNDSTEGFYKPLVKIFKHWRDRLPTELARANSYIVETLVASHLISTPISHGHAVADIFCSIFARYAPYLTTGLVPRIDDPGYPSVNVAKRWKFQEFASFINEVQFAAKTAFIALGEMDEDASVIYWKKLFGDKFAPGG